MFLSSLFFSSTLGLLAIAIFLIYKYATRHFDHWEKKKIFYFEPTPFFGNFLDIALFRTTIGEYLEQLYKKTDKPFFGIFVFDRPHLIVRDPELVKSILVKDFNCFEDRNILNHKNDPMTAHMLFLEKNPEWKVMRTKLTPVFSSGKLKAMFEHINNVGKEMEQYIDKQIPHFSVEAKEICAKYATNVIAKCAFAINAKCFQQEKAEFREMGRLVFDFRYSVAIQQTSYFFAPGLVKLFNLKFVDPKVTNFMRKAFWETIRMREKNKIIGNDLIDVLIELKNNKEFSNRIEFTSDKIISQAAQFFLAGFETTSSTIAFTLYELCIQVHIQKKARADILARIKEHGGITYDAIQDMKYLNMCIYETLRKYPVLPFLDRKCKTDYKIPGSNIVIDKGTPVFIPLFGLQYDEKYFSHPHKYQPERFSDENIKKLEGYTYLPFGDGPRNCIGERFGMLATKVGLVHILSKFEVERSSDTPVPIQFEAKSFVLASKVGLPMKFKRYIESDL